MDKALNKNYNRLIFLGIFLYFSIMFAKQIFNAEIIEIQEVFGATATNTSLVTLIYYVVYAISQAFLVLFIDKIKLRVYLSATLFVSAILTILIGIVGNMGAGLPFLFVVFALNGVLQAGNYAGLVRIFNKYLNREKYMLAMKFISIVAAVSLAGSYGLSSIFVAISRWEIPFIITGLIFLFSVALFFFGLKPTVKSIKSLGHVEKDAKEKSEKPKKVILSAKTKRLEVWFLASICIMALFGNYLYYALNNWFSKLIYDVYGIPKHYSILISVGIALLTAVASTLAITYFNKTKKGSLTTAIGFSVAAVIAAVLSFTYDLNVLYTIFMCILFIFVIQGLKTQYSAITPYEVREIIEPGKFSLIFNSMASIAAGCSPTVMSLMFENFGWRVSFISLVVISIVLVFNVVGLKVSKRKMVYEYYNEKLQ